MCAWAVCFLLWSVLCLLFSVSVCLSVCQAGWWTPCRTTATPSTSRAPACSCQPRLSCWWTASFRRGWRRLTARTATSRRDQPAGGGQVRLFRIDSSRWSAPGRWLDLMLRAEWKRNRLGETDSAASSSDTAKAWVQVMTLCDCLVGQRQDETSSLSRCQVWCMVLYRIFLLREQLITS